MKVVLDTNVFISGIFFGGPPYQILRAWRDGRIQLVLSEEILEEYLRVSEVLSERFPQVQLDPILKLLTEVLIILLSNITLASKAHQKSLSLRVKPYFKQN